MSNISKSLYCKYIQCKKMIWLEKNKIEEKEDLGNESVLKNGTEVGILARRYFGNYSLVKFDEVLINMVMETKKYLKEKSKIICEASFKYDNLFASIDILKIDDDGVSIYEVKSSSKISDIYYYDASFQSYILKNLGYKVKSVNIMYLNKNYVFNNELDLKQLFAIEDITERSIELEKDIKGQVEDINKVLDNKKEPNIDLGEHCVKPYDCPFFKYCTKKLVKPNVFDIGWRMNFSKKLECYYNGIISFKDLLDKVELSEKPKTQIEHYLNDLPPKINYEHIKDFFDSLRYPLYFLDFESYQNAIPNINGTRPNQHICFQYSLHYYEKEDGELFHKEYLSNEYDGDPMYGLCKRLCEDIPMNSCVIVYNDVFEKNRLIEMANIYPEFKEHLLNIESNIIDLLPIFRNQDYYIKDIGGSASIKNVLPALFPDDPSLNYHNLDQVHKGDEASEAYLSLKDLSKDEEEELRNNMLKYCGLDTYAMVKIYDKLKKINS